MKIKVKQDENFDLKVLSEVCKFLNSTSGHSVTSLVNSNIPVISSCGLDWDEHLKWGRSGGGAALEMSYNEPWLSQQIPSSSSIQRLATDSILLPNIIVHIRQFSWHRFISSFTAMIHHLRKMLRVDKVERKTSQYDPGSQLPTSQLWSPNYHINKVRNALVANRSVFKLFLMNWIQPYWKYFR